MRQKHLEALTTFTFYAPSLLLFGFFFVIPAVLGFAYGFTSWNGIRSDVQFVGLRNYVELLRDARFFSSISHTLLITAIQYVCFNFGSLLVAAVIEKIRRGATKTVLRVLFFFPYIIGSVIVTSVWRYLLSYREGVLNNLLRAIGLAHLAFDWLGTPVYVNISIAVMNVWAFGGFYLVLYMSALQAIDASIYESTQIDGTGAVREFLGITFPLVAPAFTVCSILALAYGLSTIDAPLILTNGGPGFASETISYYVYWSGFLGSRQGYGTAISFLLFGVTLVLSVFQGILFRRREVRF
jgi:ABC-type sugar transport system permease subunit